MKAEILRLARYLSTVTIRALRSRIDRARMVADDDGVWVSPGVELLIDGQSWVQCHSGVSIGHGTVITACSYPAEMPRGKGRVVRLIVGAGTYIGEMNNIRAAGAPIRIGAKCMISQMVTIVSSNHGTAIGLSMIDQGWSSPGDRGINIGDDVWIGAGATILPGVTVGAGAVIGSGAVVTKDVEGYSIVVGVPARVVGSRKQRDPGD